jgi:hypothetical protein
MPLSVIPQNKLLGLRSKVEQFCSIILKNSQLYLLLDRSNIQSKETKNQVQVREKPVLRKTS